MVPATRSRSHHGSNRHIDPLWFISHYFGFVFIAWIVLKTLIWGHEIYKLVAEFLWFLTHIWWEVGSKTDDRFGYMTNFAKIEFVVINTNSQYVLQLNRIVNISIYNLFCYTHQNCFRKWTQHLTNSSEHPTGVN